MTIYFILFYFFRGAKDADAADHFGNVLSMLAWTAGKELSELRKVPERDVWLMHPAIVNAWYSPNHNTISKPYDNLLNSVLQDEDPDNCYPIQFQIPILKMSGSDSNKFSANFFLEKFLDEIMLLKIYS
jgi:hypothetical protein